IYIFFFRFFRLKYPYNNLNKRTNQHEFLGLRVKSGKSYKQTVLKDYHVSHAVLDTSTVTEKEVVSLQVEVNGSSFILCNLSVEHGILQVPLECIFSKGEVIVFSISSENEEAVVHLSGYTINTSCTNCKGKIDVNNVSPLTNVTNVKTETLKKVNRIHKTEPSIKEEKENEIPSEVKQTDSKSSDKKTSQKNKNKKLTPKKKIPTLTALPKKKKRRLSPSSAGRTPIPKASKKSKIQVISASSTTNETSTNKKKNKKSSSSDSTFEKSPEEREKKNDTSSEKSDASESLASEGRKRIGMGGVVIEDLVIGTGAKASKGKRVSVYYEGKLKNGKPNEVIKAWEVGIVGMKVGGKRRIVAPPGMAYGKEGCPPEIPPKAILVFEVELKGVN
ncbi:FK506-binding nuclear protein, partial [Armadillidium nasatum]